VNGISAFRKQKTADLYRLRWDSVTYTPGKVKVVAYKDGVKLAEDTKRAVGSAIELNMIADCTTISSDGYDLSFITVAVVDENGDTVPEASNTINFTISGPGRFHRQGRS
jgi:beta-galactosidase